MIKFNQLPPTAATTEVDPEAIRFLAYGVEDRCMNGVAEVCAAMVVANTTDLAETMAIGELIGDVIKSSKVTSKPEADGNSFTFRYTQVAANMSKRIRT